VNPIPAQVLLPAIVLIALTGCAHTESLPDDGFVAVPGGRVAFRVTGKAGGIPVLMIHGGPGSTGCSYPDTMKGIAASRPVVTYDQLGSGNSDRMLNLERDAVLSRFVEEVAAIRTQLGLEEVHLVGHSWGAAVALEYLLTGDRTGVRSVTFVGPLLSTSRWIEDANSLVATLPKDAQDAIAIATSTGRFDSPEFLAANEVFESRFLARTPRSQRHLPVCDSTPVRFNAELYEYMWGPSEFLATGTLRLYDRIDRLAEIRIPTLFLVGEYDEARPETMLEFQALVPGSIVKVIPNAAHVVNVDNPQALNEAMNEFYSTVETR
jgi:proline iminopeptidase